MKKLIDLKNWNRKEHFEFFNQFDDPFFGIVTEIDCTIAYQKAKEQNVSFFLYYLHKSLLAANKIEEFRLRIVNDEVLSFDVIHASATIGREDSTFAFSFIDYKANFNDFVIIANKEIEAIKNSSGLRFNESTSRTDVVHYSSVPWFDFSGLKHEKNLKFKDSMPKITFGKFKEIDGKKKMSLSIDAHHGLVDGYHVGKFLELYQVLLNE